MSDEMRFGDRIDRTQQRQQAVVDPVVNTVAPGLEMWTPPPPQDEVGGPTLQMLNLDRFYDTTQRATNQAVYNTLKDDPIQIQRLQAASYYAQMTGTSLAFSMENMTDQYEQLNRDRTNIGSGFSSIVAAAKIGWNNMKADIEIGKLMADAMYDTNPMEALATAMEFEGRKFEEPAQYTWYQRMAVEPARIMPYAVETIIPAVTGMATGAAIAGMVATSGGTAIPLMVAMGSSAARVLRMGASAVASGRIMSGLMFYQLMQAEDEQGNRIPIEVARQVALASGALNGVLEASGFEILAGTGGSLTRALFSNAIKNQTKRMAVAGAGVAISRSLLAQYGANIGTEIVQEIAQETIDYIAYNSAVEVANNRQASKIRPQEFSEFIENIKQVAESTAIGTAMLGIPGTVNQFRSTALQAAKTSTIIKRASKVGADLKVIADAVQNNDYNAVVQEMQRATDNVYIDKEVEIESTDAGFKAVYRGNDVAGFEVAVDGNTVSIQSANFGDVTTESGKKNAGTVANRLIDKIYETNIESVIEFKDDQDVIKRAIEDRYADLKDYNVMIDNNRSDIEFIQSEIESIQKEVDSIGVVEGEEISPANAELRLQRQAELESLQLEKTQMESELGSVQSLKDSASKGVFDRRENYVITRAEYKQKSDDIKKKNAAINTPIGRKIYQTLKDTYNKEIITEYEANMFIEVVKFVADRNGMSFEEYIAQAFGNDTLVFGDRKFSEERLRKNARAAMIRNGVKRIIFLTDQADFKSLMHETAHVFAFTLTEEQRKVVAKWAGEPTIDAERWSMSTHEDFVSAYFQWINNKQEFSSPLKQVFEYFKQFIQKIRKSYEIIDPDRVISPEMNAMFDAMFEPTTIESFDAIVEQSPSVEIDSARQELLRKEYEKVDRYTTLLREGDGMADMVLQTYRDSLEKSLAKIQELKRPEAEVAKKIVTDADKGTITDAEFKVVEDGDTIELNEDNTNSKRFRAWFGDSKVVDENGNPRIVYHGTHRDFNGFPIKELGMHFGSTVTQAQDRLNFNASRNKIADFRTDKDKITDKEISEIDNQLELIHPDFPGKITDNTRIRNDLLIKKESLIKSRGQSNRASVVASQGARIIPAYIKLENPIRLPDLFDWNLQALKSATGIDANSVEEIVSNLKDMGYDGVIYNNAVEGVRSDKESTGIIMDDSYIVFSQSQIRSAYSSDNQVINGIINTFELNEELEASTEYRDQLKQAIADLQPVPTSAIERFIGEDWADAEILRRQAEVHNKSVRSDLYKKAKESKSLNDFIQQNSNEDINILKDIWHDSNIENVRMGNQAWFNALSEAGIEEILDMAKAGVWTADDIMSLISKNDWNGLSDQNKKAIRKYIRNNATEIRRLLATQWIDRNTDVMSDRSREMRVQLSRELLRTSEADFEVETNVNRLTQKEIIEQIGIIRSDKDYVMLRRQRMDIKFLDNLSKDYEKITEQNIQQELKDLTQLQRALETIENVQDGNNRGNVNKLLTDIKKIIKYLEKGTFTEYQAGVYQNLLSQKTESIINSLAEGKTAISEYNKYKKAQEKSAISRKKTSNAKRIMKDMRAIARSIKRMSTSGAVNIVEKQKIMDIYAKVATNFDGSYESARIQAIKKMKAESPADFNRLSKKERAMADVELQSMTIDQLYDAYEEAKLLKEEGRANLKAKKAEQKAYEYSVAALLYDGLDYDEDKVNEEKKLRTGRFDKPGFKDRMRNLWFESLNGPRLFDMLDGGAGFYGANHNFFVNDVNVLEAQKISNIRRRKEGLQAKLASIGFETKSILDMEEKINKLLRQNVGEALGTKYNVNQVLEMYAGFKNELKKTAIILGIGNDRIVQKLRDHEVRFKTNLSKENALLRNQIIAEEAKIIETELQSLVDKLTDEQKSLGDFIIEDYAENFSRVEQATAIHENLQLGQEEYYTPLVMLGRNVDVHEGQLRDEILQKHALQRAGLDKGFQIDRIKNIDVVHRLTVKLGLYENWNAQMEKAEHYMSFRKWQGAARAMINGNNFVSDKWRNSIENGIDGGRELLKQIDDYVDNKVIAPTAMRFDGNFDEVGKHLRSATATGYLAFNMATVLKQAPSMMFYLVEASPVDMFNAMGEMSKDSQGFIEAAKLRNPELWKQSMDRDLDIIAEEVIAGKDISEWRRNVNKWGMSLIKTVDIHVKAIGETAVYNNAINRGLSHQEAVNLARNVTNRTQPVGGAKDSSSMFTKNKTIYFMTMFSKQLNQIWNITTYDIGHAYSKKQFAKQKIGSLISLAISSYMIWAISNRQAVPDTDDPEEIAMLIGGQVLSSMPIMGPIISASLAGYSPELAVTSPLAAIGSTLNISIEAIKGDASEFEVRRWADQLLEGAAIATGMIPYTAANRLTRAVQEMSEGELNVIEGFSTALFGGPFTINGKE